MAENIFQKVVKGAEKGPRPPNTFESAIEFKKNKNREPVTSGEIGRLSDPGKKISLREFAEEVDRQRNLRIAKDGNKLDFLSSIEVDEKAAAKAFGKFATFETEFKGQEGARARTTANLLGARSTILSGGADTRAGLRPKELTGGSAQRSGRRALLASRNKRVDDDNLLGRSVVL